MLYLLNFIYNNWTSTIPIVISTISLILSLLNLALNRKRLDVEIEDQLDNIEKIYFNALDYENKDPALNFGKGKVCFVKIVNPSPKDIAFFDLRIIDMNTSEQPFFISKATMELAGNPNQKLFYDSSGIMAKLNYPEANYGIFKSNSFTRLDIAFFPSSESTQIFISFKVAISTFRKNRESRYRRKFKYYRKTFNVDL
nr:MAG TPA: hypothetical protein [Caudoviricetes sp.]